MPHTMNINSAQGYVHLSYTGLVELSERQIARNEVFAACFEHNIHRALVDLRESDIRMSESDIIKFASSFKDTERPHNYRLAVVSTPENQSENLIEIIISIDGIDVKYFFELDEAIHWLTAVQ